MSTKPFVTLHHSAGETSVLLQLSAKDATSLAELIDGKGVGYNAIARDLFVAGEECIERNRHTKPWRRLRKDS